MDGFVKRRAAAPAGLFAAEAAGLAWLRVPGGAPVVEVLELADDSITVSRVRPVAATAEAARLFGARLAVTHNAGAEAFGAPPTGFTGPSFIADLPMSTDPARAWGAFYAEQRLAPYARLAAGELGSRGLAVVDALAARLTAGAFDDDAPPARLHGDLWSGNVLFGPVGATLIDPSAHGGHRLTDLAMLALFGAPHLDAVFQGYEEASTSLPDGWRELIGLHQVYPLLVHAALFGGGYGRTAVARAADYL